MEIPPRYKGRNLDRDNKIDFEPNDDDVMEDVKRLTDGGFEYILDNMENKFFINIQNHYYIHFMRDETGTIYLAYTTEPRLA